MYHAMVVVDTTLTNIYKPIHVPFDGCCRNIYNYFKHDCVDSNFRAYSEFAFHFIEIIYRRHFSTIPFWDSAGAWPHQVKFTLPRHLFTHLGFPSVRVVLSITFIPGFVIIME